MAPRYASSGFEVGNALDARAYPTARRNRTGPPPTGSLGGPGGGSPLPAPPQSRLLSFNVSCNPGLRTTGSSTKVYGPALLLELHVVATVGSTGNFSLEVGIAPNPVAEQDVAITTPKEWRPITERISQNAVAEPVARVGFAAVSSQAGIPRSMGKLNYVVFDPEFFVTFSVVSSGVAGSGLMGHLAVLQQLTADQLAALLG